MNSHNVTELTESSDFSLPAIINSSDLFNAKHPLMPSHKNGQGVNHQDNSTTTESQLNSDDNDDGDLSATKKLALVLNNNNNNKEKAKNEYISLEDLKKHLKLKTKDDDHLKEKNNNLFEGTDIFNSTSTAGGGGSRLSGGSRKRARKKVFKSKKSQNFTALDSLENIDSGYAFKSPSSKTRNVKGFSFGLGLGRNKRKYEDGVVPSRMKESMKKNGTTPVKVGNGFGDSFIREIKEIEYNFDKHMQMKKKKFKIKRIKSYDFNRSENGEKDENGRSSSNLSRIITPYKRKSVFLENNINMSENQIGIEDFFEINNQNPLRLQYDPILLKQQNMEMGSFSKVQKSLKDHQLMARACHRAGKQRLEALCYYNLAIMYEERNQFKLAIKNFEKFYDVCHELKDILGECLALNRLGVMYFKLGGKENFKISLGYHTKHWELANTENKIVSHINLGLIFLRIGTKKGIKNSIEHFRRSLEYCREVGDISGESICLHNLGILEKKNGNFSNAMKMMKEHLQISKKTKDSKSESMAYQNLGVLELKKGENDNAIKMFKKARQISQQSNDLFKSNQLKCYLGIIKGKKQFENKVKDKLIGLNNREIEN